MDKKKRTAITALKQKFTKNFNKPYHQAITDYGKNPIQTPTVFDDETVEIVPRKPVVTKTVSDDEEESWDDDSELEAREEEDNEVEEANRLLEAGILTRDW